MIKYQKGFSLWNVIAVGVLVILSIVYGRHIINIHYNAYSLTQKAKDIIKEASNNKDDKQLIKSLRTKADFDKQGHIYEDSDVIITRENGNITMSISYRECASINDSWEVCADKEITTE